MKITSAFFSSSKFHLVATIAWLVGGGIASYLWSSAVPWLTAMSLYSIVVGHWSAYQAKRGEEVTRELASAVKSKRKVATRG